MGWRGGNFEQNADGRNRDRQGGTEGTANRKASGGDVRSEGRTGEAMKRMRDRR